MLEKIEALVANATLSTNLESQRAEGFGRSEQGSCSHSKRLGMCLGISRVATRYIRLPRRTCSNRRIILCRRHPSSIRFQPTWPHREDNCKSLFATASFENIVPDLLRRIGTASCIPPYRLLSPLRPLRCSKSDTCDTPRTSIHTTSEDMRQ